VGLLYKAFTSSFVVFLRKTVSSICSVNSTISILAAAMAVLMSRYMAIWKLRHFTASETSEGLQLNSCTFDHALETNTLAKLDYNSSKYRGRPTHNLWNIKLVTLLPSYLFPANLQMPNGRYNFTPKGSNDAVYCSVFIIAICCTIINTCLNWNR